MSGGKNSCTELKESVQPTLSPESQKDLEEALDETPTPESVQKAWVEENRSDLLRAFSTGKKTDLAPYRNVEIFSAVEGTEQDLRQTLVSILPSHVASQTS